MLNGLFLIVTTNDDLDFFRNRLGYHIGRNLWDDMNLFDHFRVHVARRMV
jgi:hypothetical protein